MSELEPVSNCCYAPLRPWEGSSMFFYCSACGEPAIPATDVAKDSGEETKDYYCKWCGKWTDHSSNFCPVKLAQVEAATHQL